MRTEEFITYFTNHADYIVFKNSEDFVLPNVSYCEEEEHVHYNPYFEPITDVVITYNVTSTTEYTTIYQFDNWDPEPWFEETIEIDGVKSPGHTLVKEDGINSILFDTEGLHTIKFTPTSTIIGKNAFWAMTNIVEVYIPEGITRINDEAFNYSPALTAITLPSTLEYIGAYGLQDTALTAITVPANCEIGNFAMMDNRQLKTLVIEDGIEKLGNYSFRSCAELESLTLPSTLKDTGNDVFHLCQKLNNVTLPNGLEYIRSRAFSNTNLSTITIPNTVTLIDANAFSSDSNLESVIFEETSQVASIGANAFSSCKLSSIDIPNSVTSIGSGCFSTNFELTAITLSENITEIDDTTFARCTALTGVTIPNGVTRIGGRVFSGCTAMSEINLPSSITTIGDSAFAGMTSLVDITIPENVTAIGASAFTNTSALETVTVNASVVPTLGANAFKNAKTGFKVLVPCDLVDDYQKADGWKTYKNNIEGIPGYSCNTIKAIINPISERYNVPCNCSMTLTRDEYIDKVETVYMITTKEITDLEPGCFSGLTSVTSITLDQSDIETIPASCYRGSGILADFLPNSIIEIGMNAYSGCTQLSEIRIGSNIEEIKTRAFAGCTSLTAITINAIEPPIITATTFPKNGTEYTNFTIYVPAESVETYKTYDEVWQGLADKIQAIP